MSSAYTCENCGAPLRVTPETLVAICQYCGHPNWIRETASKELLVVRGSTYEELMEAYKREFGSRRGFWRNAIPVDAQCYYVPFILANASVDVSYRGVYMATITVYRKEVRRRYDEERDRWVEEEYWVYDFSTTETISVGGGTSARYALNVLARRAEERRGVEKVAEHYRATAPQPQPFTADIAKAERAEVLAAEISVEEARKMVVDEARDMAREEGLSLMRRRARARAEAIAAAYESADRRAEVSSINPVYEKVATRISKLEVSPITLLPCWILTYEYSGSVYKILFSGWDLRPLVIEEPLTLAARAAYSVAAGAVAGACGGVGLPLLLMGLHASGGQAVIGGLLLVAGAAVGYFIAGYALRGLKVEYRR